MHRYSFLVRFCFDRRPEIKNVLENNEDVPQANTFMISAATLAESTGWGGVRSCEVTRSAISSNASSRYLGMRINRLVMASVKKIRHVLL